jgi:hypothetical protein
MPTLLAAKLGRTFQWDRFVGFVFFTVFLAYEVQYRSIANAFPFFEC